MRTDNLLYTTNSNVSWRLLAFASAHRAPLRLGTLARRQRSAKTTEKKKISTRANVRYPCPCLHNPTISDWQLVSRPLPFSHIPPSHILTHTAQSASFLALSKLLTSLPHLTPFLHTSSPPLLSLVSHSLHPTPSHCPSHPSSLSHCLSPPPS